MRYARRGLLGTTLALALLAAPGAHASSPLPSAELVTVTQRSFVATWTTSEPQDTTVCWSSSGQSERCRREEDATRYHYASVGGLRPGIAYRYRLLSGGTAQVVSATNPGRLLTLTRPPGRHLFDFAVLNDMHVGEGCSGTAFSAPLIGSLPPCFSADQYATRMGEAAVGEIARRGIGLTVVDGDLTSSASYEQVVRARDVLAGLRGAVLVARGNHDRAGQHASETRCGADEDCLRALLFDERPPGRIAYGITHHGYHFVILDSSDASGNGDLTDATQNAWLAADLAAHRDEPTFIAFHHPVTEYADTYAVPPVVFGVRPDKGGSAFLDLIAANPQVVGVLNAHTHRNFVSYAPRIGARVPFVENGAAKEYPGGYAVYSVYAGGYTRSFFRPSSCAFCRAWTETTRGEYFGLYPLYTLGPLSARNFTHLYGCAAPTPPASLPGQNSLVGTIVPPPSCSTR